MKMPITIREATTADAALIADLSRQTFYDTFVHENTKEDMDLFLSQQFTRAALIAEVGAPGNIFFIAYDDDAVVGYARLREGSDTTTLEIARLYAVKERIGKGVGKALMQTCINEAINRNKKTIWLGVWEKNARAIAFYQAWGFEKVGEHDFLLGHDTQRDWIMQKQLDA